MDYLIHILILVSIYTILAISLDMLVGQTGLLSITHAGFYGIGAYSAALLSTIYHFPFALALLAGMLLACLVSFVVSLPSLRLQDDYFVIATFGFQMILFNVFNNCMELTRGPLGISGISRPVIFDWHIDSHIEFMILAVIFAFFTFYVVNRISSSPFGRVLRAIREDEVLAKSLGKNVFLFKVAAFAVSAALAASAGTLYAHYITYIDPTSFTVMESILIISMVIIGGAGTKWGPIIGAVVLVTLPEVLRFIGLPSSVAANLRQVIYGGALVVIVMWRPRGLLGESVFQGRGARK